MKKRINVLISIASTVCMILGLPCLISGVTGNIFIAFIGGVMIFNSLSLLYVYLQYNSDSI